MQITDLHIHSKYSRMCSKNLDLEHIEHWCQIKGIDIVACADFTFPGWLKEIETKLEPQGNGLFRLNSPDIAKAVRQESPMSPANARDVHFILGTEISCIYRQGDATRRVHLLVIFPEIDNVRKFIAELEKRGAKLGSDGRPILGIPAKEIAKIMFDINERAMLIPAHVWTPWFAVFGSKSGFDSVEECFEEYSDHIFALETGLSSDPAMNWRLSQNDKYTLISNSDAHGPDNMGREANVFDLPEISYDQIYDTIKQGDPKRFLYTIEFFPEEGKYHLDGHSNCEFSCMPEETVKHGGRCPQCGKKITVGVYSRVSELADQPLGREPDNKIPYKSIIPLAEIISDAVGVGKKSKRVMTIYADLINKVGNEFHVLLDAEIEAIADASFPLIGEGVRRVRNGEVQVEGGYDGVFGTIKIFKDEERENGKKQSSLL